MAMQRRKRETTRPELMRARILEAASSLFADKGAEGLSMRAIATRAGMPTMTVYGYFANKIAIIRGLWSLAFDPLFAEMRRVELNHEHPVAKLSAVAHCYVEYWIRYPDLYRLIFLIEDKKVSGSENWFIEETEVVSSFLHFGPLIAAAKGTPELDCRQDAEALICALTGIAHMAITVSEYDWGSPVDYINRILPAFAEIRMRNEESAS